MYGHISVRQNVFINHKAKFEWQKLSSVTKLAMRLNGAIYINMICINVVVKYYSASANPVVNGFILMTER